MSSRYFTRLYKTLLPQHVPLEDYIAFKNVSALVILEHLEYGQP